jgi:hypothetical protein
LLDRREFSPGGRSLRSVFTTSKVHFGRKAFAKRSECLWVKKALPHRPKNPSFYFLPLNAAPV